MSVGQTGTYPTDRNPRPRANRVDTGTLRYNHQHAHNEPWLTRRFEVAMLEIVTDLSQATDFFLLLDKFDLLIHHDVKPHNHES